LCPVTWCGSDVTAVSVIPIRRNHLDFHIADAVGGETPSARVVWAHAASSSHLEITHTSLQALLPIDHPSSTQDRMHIVAFGEIQGNCLRSSLFTSADVNLVPDSYHSNKRTSPLGRGALCGKTIVVTNEERVKNAVSGDGLCRGKLKPAVTRSIWKDCVA
jgi:hypothetical protein